MAASVSNLTGVGLVNTQTNAGSIQLPLISQTPNRQLIFKDQYGNLQNNPLTLLTQTPDTFEDGTTTKVLNNSFGFMTLYGFSNKWYVIGGTNQASMTISSIVISSINGSLLVTDTQLLSTTRGLETYISSFIDPAELQSTIVSTVIGTGQTSNFVSTVVGLGSAGYVSTLSLVSTVQDLQRAFSTGTLTTSSLQFLDLNTQVPQILLVSSGVLTLNGSNVGSSGGGGTGGISLSQLVSTTGGLGTAGYLSSIPAILSTSQLLTSSAVISTATIRIMSSFQTFACTALITTGTISSVNTNTITLGSGAGWILTSPIQTAAISTNTLYAENGNITTGTLTTGIISTVTTNNLNFGSGSGWILTSPIQTAVVSSTYSFANFAYMNNAYIGSVSTVNSAQFYGLFGNYNNTVIAEISTGAGTQELLVFKGSSASDRVRVQTTGNFVIETGVSARLWQSNTLATLPLATPAFLITTSSNVGIQTSNPGATLDVNGTARAITFSSQRLYVSSINDSLIPTGAQLVSTTGGLQTSLLSTTGGLQTSLLSTTGGLQTSLLSTTGGIYTTTGTQLVSTTGDLQTSLLSTTGGIYTTTGTQLLSTTGGLQTSLLSTTGGLNGSLLSTTRGLETYISTFIDPTELQSTIVSTVIGVGQTSNFVSTVVGLGTVGYVSTASLISTTGGLQTSLLSTTGGIYATTGTQFLSTTGGLQTSLLSTTDGIYATTGTQLLSTTGGLNNNLFSTTRGLETYISSFIDPIELQSTIVGLGTFGYLSTASGGGGVTPAQLLSTTTGLQSSLVSTVRGLGSAGYLSSIPAVLSTSQLFTSSAVVSTGTFNIVSTLVLNASTVTTTQVTTSTIATNAITIATNPSWILTSPIQTLAVSTNTLWTDQGYITTGTLTTGTISSLATNAVTLGTGSTWILAAPIQTSVVSSIFMYANNPFFDTVNIGSVSTMNSLEFYGLFGNYNNTVLAEISTGAGTQELLLFKGSSVSDRVRVQTTGNFVVETGVSARLWNSNTLTTLSNATPAFIVNTSSNVGIQTNSPQTALDVNGTGRFVTMSSLALFASSIVAPYVFAPQFFTF